MPLNLLIEPIRKYIRDKRWEQLRPIQIAAIDRILNTDSNYILASRTASGKTEAAFLPILSKIDFNENGVQVLYISPLIALINDQFYRIEELCSYLEIPVTKWHGEANRTDKNKLINMPEGIVLITPESLEAMFINKPFNIKQLFSNLKFVVIDEIHSFIGTDRGVQLKSILFRLQNINNIPFRVIGLSATIGDYFEAKEFTGNGNDTKVLLDKTVKKALVTFRYFNGNSSGELPLELLKDLYVETKNSKVLVFPNSRGLAEEVAVKLKKISERVGGHSNCFSHHSSVHKEVREYVEHFAKNNSYQNFTIACTSTLELGIDIGTVDKIIQVNATHSISSLIQRIGRSGRKDDQQSRLYLYSTDKWNLLQSLASWLLYKEGFIEPPFVIDKPYDIFLHQALSIVKEHSGINYSDLINILSRNFAFSKITTEETIEIIDHLINTDLLEKMRHELIVGIEGEKIVNSRDFYSVFKTEENFKVIGSGNTIGEIPFSPQIRIDENILLAARIWKICDIDLSAKKIHVKPAKDGKKPMFFGSGGIIHSRIREKMLEILLSLCNYEELDQPSLEEIKKFRSEFLIFNIDDIVNQRPALVKDTTIEFHTFSGTKINRTIQLLLDLVGLKNTLSDNNSCIIVETLINDLRDKWHYLKNFPINIDCHISEILDKTPSLLDFSKWGKLLPKKYQVYLIKCKYYDIEGFKEFVKRINLTSNQN